MENVAIRVFHTENYQNTAAAIDIKKTARDLNIPINLNTNLITSPEQAEQNRFLGSPTIHVNGLDIEPAAKAARFFGIT